MYMCAVLKLRALQYATAITFKEEKGHYQWHSFLSLRATVIIHLSEFNHFVLTESSTESWDEAAICLSPTWFTLHRHTFPLITHSQCGTLSQRDTQSE